MYEKKKRLGWLGLLLVFLAALLFTFCDGSNLDNAVDPPPVEEPEPQDVGAPDPNAVEEWTENTYEDTGQVDELLVDDPATYDTTDLNGELPFTGWDDGGLFVLAIGLLLMGGMAVILTRESS